MRRGNKKPFERVEMATEAEKTVVTKIPAFSGKPEEWESWRLKFEAVLYQKDICWET